MSISHLTIPSFRVPNRLISWMQMNDVRERVYSAEKVFFKEKLGIETRARGLVQYAKLVGKLPEDMEDIITGHPDSCVAYANIVHDAPQKIIDACGDHPMHIIRMAGALDRRIEHLENKIETPEHYVDYVAEVRERVPEMEDRILFSGLFPDHIVAMAAKRLIECLDNHSYKEFSKESPYHDQRLRDLVKKDSEATMKLMDFVAQKGLKLDPEFHQSLAGVGMRLSKLAEHLRSRLSPELEMTWTGSPGELVNYAVRWVRGRLPEALESVLVGDQRAAGQYAFQVIRGFSSPRLSDALHAFMVMKSFEDPNDSEIKRYINECDRVVDFNRNYEAGTNA